MTSAFWKRLLHPGRLRVFTGFTLMIYVVTHFLNHSLGIIGIAEMEAGRRIFEAFWRSPFLFWVTPTALTLHVSLVLYDLASRRSLQRSAVEWTQLVLGLLIPLMLLGHVTNTRLAATVYQIETTYVYQFAKMAMEGTLPLLFLLSVIVWVHSVIGIYLWMRLKAWYSNVAYPLFGGAVLLPALAVIGILLGVREFNAKHSRRVDFPASIVNEAGATENIRNTLQMTLNAATGAYILLVGGIFAFRALRGAAGKRGRRYTQSYPDGNRVTPLVGMSILEGSVSAGIPHAHVCGGRGRCSTCRVGIDAGLESVEKAGAEESAVLARVGAGPRVRLACQVRPVSDVAITLLVPPNTTHKDVRDLPRMQGREMEITVLFADLRGFTKLAEKRLPYDVVFLLNQYFQTMGSIIESHGGRVDKFIGDGIMALFGTNHGAPASESAASADGKGSGVNGKGNAGAHGAILAALEMCNAIEAMTEHNKHHLDSPLRIGVGIHSGHAIVGDMGFKNARSITAIGDTVNTASRLEQATKPLGAKIVVSTESITLAGTAPDGAVRRRIKVKGKDEPIEVYVIGNGIV